MDTIYCELHHVLHFLVLICILFSYIFFFFFFFNDTATTEIYTLSLHDALPICLARVTTAHASSRISRRRVSSRVSSGSGRSEEHTSELQSRRDLVCRLLLEKKKKKKKNKNKQNT